MAQTKKIRQQYQSTSQLNKINKPEVGNIGKYANVAQLAEQLIRNQQSKL